MVQKVFGIRETKKGPKLVNCCKPEQIGTKEFGKMMKIETDGFQRVRQMWPSGRDGDRIRRLLQVKDLGEKTRKQPMVVWSPMEKG